MCINTVKTHVCVLSQNLEVKYLWDCYIYLKCWETLIIVFRRLRGLVKHIGVNSGWCHQMETFSALLALCEGNSPVAGEFLAQRPVTRSWDVFFDLRLNKRLSRPSKRWWFQTQSRLLWRHSYVAGSSAVQTKGYRMLPFTTCEKQRWLSGYFVADQFWQK